MKNEFKKGVEVIIIKHFHQESEAQFYISRLEHEGIECFLSNTNMNNVFKTDFSDITLHIRREDEQKALPIIEELDIQLKSETPNFSIENASPEDIEIEKALIASRQKKSDRTYYLLIAIMLIVTIAFAVWNYLSYFS